MFGRETKPIFEHMINNIDVLNEVANVNGKFLFEDIGEKNIENHLNEGPIGTGIRNIQNAIPSSGRIAKEIAKGGAKLPAAAGFLKGLWSKFKTFGKGIFGRLKLLVTKRVPWLASFFKKGFAFIASSPILKIAVPAVAIAGGVAAGIALINRLRKRAKRKKMSKTDEKDLRAMVQKKDTEIEKYRKMGLDIKKD